MKKQHLIVGITVLLLVIGFCGCEEFQNVISEESKFYGRWRNEREGNNTAPYNTSTTFYPHGDIIIESNLTTINGIWELEEGLLILKMKSEGMEIIMTFRYFFSNNDTTLTISPIEKPAKPENELVLVKQ